MRSSKSRRASNPRFDFKTQPSQHGEFGVVDLHGRSMSTKELAMMIASRENVSIATSLSLIEYQDGAVRPVGILVFDVLADDHLIVDMIAVELGNLIEEGRRHARAPGGSV